MSYESDLRGKAHKILQKCNEWAVKMQNDPHTTLTPQQQAEMKTWSQIPSLFEPFAQLPDPEGLIFNIIEELRGVMGELNDNKVLPPDKEKLTGSDIPFVGDIHLQSISTYIDDWTGSAAKNFNDNFVKTFPEKVQSKFHAAYVLRSACQAYQTVWKNGRKDAMEIANKALDAVDGGCELGGGDAAMVMTVVGSVAAVASAVVVGPVSAAVVALQVVAGAAQIGAAAAGGDKKSSEISISGPDPLTIVPKLRYALNKLKTEINKEQEKVFDIMEQNLSTLRDSKDKLVARRPQLAGANRGNVKILMGDAY